MATNLKNRSKKLYFDVLLADATTNASFPCTQIVASTPGDRYGCLLEALHALTGSAPSGKKRANAVSLWFNPTAAALQNATTPMDFLFSARFVQPTSRGTNQTGLQALPYLTVGGAAVANLAGHEAIYGTAGSVRHFSAQVRKLASSAAGGTISVRGVLYVQRQHSIEV